jgi:hypothetical protein
MAPNDMPWLGLHTQGLDPMLTPYLSGQPMPGNQRYSYVPIDQAHPPSDTPQYEQSMPGTNPSTAPFRMSYTPPSQFLPNNNSNQPYYSGMSFGNAPPPSFSQHLPPLGTSNFQNAGDSGNGGTSIARDLEIQRQ